MNRSITVVLGHTNQRIEGTEALKVVRSLASSSHAFVKMKRLLWHRVRFESSRALGEYGLH
jgi:hypothetical protein